mgnify:CR=1 FL=1
MLKKDLISKSPASKAIGIGSRLHDFVLQLITIFRRSSCEISLSFVKGVTLVAFLSTKGGFPWEKYLYFENKQDLVNKTYIEVKAEYTEYAFETYNENMSVEEGFKLIWKRIANFKLKECENAMFLAQCDNTPMIDEPSRQEGIKHLQPLLDLWAGRQENIYGEAAVKQTAALVLAQLKAIDLVEAQQQVAEFWQRR